MDLFNDLPEIKNHNTDETFNENKKRSLDAEQSEESNKSPKKQIVSNSTEQEISNNEPKSSEKIKRFILKAFASEKQGERDLMCDRHVIIENFSTHLKTYPDELKNFSYYAVFDGHAGTRAAEYCAENMHKILADKFSKAFQLKNNLDLVEKEIKRHFIETFKQCDEEFLKIAAKNKPAWKDGTTATVLLLVNSTLYAANVGDSKAIACKSKETENKIENEKDILIELTKDHLATNYEERKRIQSKGGYVRDGRVLGALELSRSIGDGPFKAYGVLSSPDVRKCQLNDSYKYAILACDGLWKSFTNEEAADFINMHFKPGNQKAFEVCCEKIAIESLKKLSADNVTVLIISINSF